MENDYEENIRLIHGLRLYLKLVNQILKSNQYKTDMRDYFIREQLATVLQIKKLSQATQADLQINEKDEQRRIGEDRKD